MELELFDPPGKFVFCAYLAYIVIYDMSTQNVVIL